MLRLNLPYIQDFHHRTIQGSIFGHRSGRSCLEGQLWTGSDHQSSSHIRRGNTLWGRSLLFRKLVICKGLFELCSFILSTYTEVVERPEV